MWKTENDGYSRGGNKDLLTSSRRAPAPPQINAPSTAPIDKNSQQQMKNDVSQAANQAEQSAHHAADKTSQKSSDAAATMKEKASEARDYTSQKSSELADSASKNYQKASASAKKNADKAEREIKSEYNELLENRDNPVVIGNAVLIAAGAAGLAYGGYQKHTSGQLDWQLAGTAAAVVAVIGVADYYLSQYLFKNKYPKK